MALRKAASLRCIAGANCGAVFTKADITRIMSDLFDSPVTTAQWFNLVQGDTLAVEAGNPVFDGNRFFLGAMLDGSASAAYDQPNIGKGQAVIEGWRTL